MAPRRWAISAALAPPLLPGVRDRPWRGHTRCSATGGSTARSRRRSQATLDLAAFGWVGARAVWGALLPRDDPRRPAPAQAVLEKARKLLGRAKAARRQSFIKQLHPLLNSAQRDEPLLVYLDEAHIHQDVDLGYGWGERGKRFHVVSASPGLAAKVSFYGLYLYNEGQVRIWPYTRANGTHTIDVLRRLRAEIPSGKLTVLWDGAPYHREDGLVRRSEPGHPSAATTSLQS